MKKAKSMVWLFSFALLLGLNSTALAQRDAGSLLDTILNEATRQGGRPPEDSPYYGSNPRDPDDYYSDRYYDARQGRRLTCESKSSQYNYCRTNVRGRIRLEKQLSDAPCRKYDTWGADGDGSGVWVSNGCRAEFVVEPRRPGPSYGEGGKGRGRQATITCESQNGRQSYCRTNSSGRVRLERQLSDAPCRENETWGADDGGRGVWVTSGCRAEFSIEARRDDYGGGWEGRGRTIVCKSENYQSNYCRTGVRGDVSLQRQLSEALCREYDTWGSDRDGGGIWVDRGCEGEFSIR